MERPAGLNPQRIRSDVVPKSIAKRLSRYERGLIPCDVQARAEAMASASRPRVGTTAKERIPAPDTGPVSGCQILFGSIFGLLASFQAGPRQKAAVTIERAIHAIDLRYGRGAVAS